MNNLIVITGVSRGLGLALTEEFAAAGYTVAGSARDTAAIARLSGQLSSPHRFDTVNLADHSEVKSWADDVLSSHGTPRLLINNAAIINRNSLLWQVPVDEFSSLIDINIKGVFYAIHSFIPAMISSGEGVIVNLSSGWGRSVSPEVAPYCTSKWAIEGMTQALATELPEGLAAVALNPGIIHTDMLLSCFREAAKDYRSPQEWARTAVPFLLDINANDNGKPLTAP